MTDSVTYINIIQSGTTSHFPQSTLTWRLLCVYGSGGVVMFIYKRLISEIKSIAYHSKCVGYNIFVGVSRITIF